MKKITLKTHHLIRFCLMLSFFPSLFFGLILINYAQPPIATVSVSPQSITAAIGQDFSINVNATNVLDLYGWEFKLSWNQTLLDAIVVIEGPFLKAGGLTFFSPKINNTVGYVLLDCTLVGYIPGVSGSGILATITFHVKSGGECPLDVYDVILLDSFEQPISCQTVDGYGFFTFLHDVAVTNVSALPIIVLPSGVVNISVTVQNQGSFAEVFNVTVNASSQIIDLQLVSLINGSSTTVEFAWNTTGFGKGEYTITASATIVQGEADTNDNIRSADSAVTILDPSHDIAVIRATTSKTVVGQGYSIDINVTVKNYGIFSETFNVTVYANATIIQKQTVTLASGDRLSTVFSWNTSEYAKGSYTIKAVADTVPNEMNTTDNSLDDGWVIVAMVGDITGSDGYPDGICDMMDIRIVAKAFGIAYPDLRYNPNIDINDDKTIDMKDIRAVAKHFGETEA